MASHRLDFISLKWNLCPKVKNKVIITKEVMKVYKYMQFTIWQK